MTDRSPQGAGADRRRPAFERLCFGVAAVVSIVAAGCWTWRLVMPPLEVYLPSGLIDSMVYCPRGVLRAAPAQPALTVGDFWIDRFEVTQADFKRFVEATGYRPAGSWDRMPRERQMGADECPVSGVSLIDARAFAAWSGKRIPTAAEWDWAASGPTGRRFPWNEGYAPNYANTVELQLNQPTRIGTFYNGRSQFCGAYDLVGNVAEWTETQVRTGFESRYVVRGGSFRVSGVDAMPTPSVGEAGVEDHASQWDRAQLEHMATWATDIGFRCVVDRTAAEADQALRHAVLRLGARDPVGYVAEVLPARRTIMELGARVSARTLQDALRIQREDVVRERIGEVLRALESR